jgi:MFS family permease
MLRNRSLLAISLAVGISFVGVGMVLPVRILYAQAHGASLAIIGAMASAFLLSSFLFQYPVGWLADLWGRKRVMAFGLAAQAIVSVLYLVFPDPIAFVVLRFVEGAVFAATVPAARALVADVVPDERRGEAYGIFGAFTNGGFLFGPALGGLFAAAGYSSAFIGSCVFRIVALAVVLALVPQGNRHPEARARARAVPRRALFTRPLIGTYLLVFGDNLFFGFELTLLPLWLRNHLGASVGIIGLSYAVWALPNMVAAPIGGRLADRRRRSAVIVAFGLAQSAMYATYGSLSWWVPVVIVFGLHGLVYALMSPSVDATLATASPVDARARAQGVYNGIGMVGAFLAANTLGLLYGVNFRLPLFALAIGFGACVLGGATLIRLSEPSIPAPLEHGLPAAGQ